MQAAAIKWKRIQKFGSPLKPSTSLLLFFSQFHSTPASLVKWQSKWDIGKGEGSNQQPSKTYIRYAVRQKRADAKRALKNLLLNGKPSKHYFQDEKLAWGAEEIGSRRKECSHSRLKKSKRSESSRTGSKRWQNKKSFYNDEGDYQQPEPKFSASFAGYRCYTWSYESWESSNFQSSTSGFEWREDSKWEKARKRAWNESGVENASTNVGSYSHRVALGLPPTGPLKLDDVKSAYRASALKWHPDKHQGPSQAIAGEKFKRCVDAYNSLSNALKST